MPWPSFDYSKTGYISFRIYSENCLTTNPNIHKMTTMYRDKYIAQKRKKERKWPVRQSKKKSQQQEITVKKKFLFLLYSVY